MRSKSGERMSKRNCKEEGHELEEVMTVAGYKCKLCGYYKAFTTIQRYGLGRCPKCDAPREKLEANPWGSERIEYKCKNCGHIWRELM